MLSKALLVAVPVSIVLLGSLVAFVKTRSMSALLWSLGSACLCVVVLTHVAEAMQWFPGMGWGQPDTGGHYVDLTSAVLGVLLLLGGMVIRVARKP